MKIDSRGKLMALALVVTTASLCLAPPARAEVAAEFAGRVLAADGVTPLAGADVILLDLETRTEHRTQPTHTNGGFSLEVPPGTYTVVIQTADGAYLASRGLPLVAGANQPLLLAISQETTGSVPAGLAAEGGWPGWAKWVIVGGIVVIGAVVMNEVTQDGDAPASPF